MSAPTPGHAQSPPDGGQSRDGVWQIVSEFSIPNSAPRADIVGAYAVARLSKTTLDALLARAPLEDASTPGRGVVITLPLPDGRFSRFRIEESPVLAPELAAAFPDIKTYRGAGIDDPTATARLDSTADGFHAMVIAAGGTVYIDPYARGDLTHYISYNKADLRKKGTGLDEIPPREQR